MMTSFVFIKKYVFPAIGFKGVKPGFFFQNLLNTSIFKHCGDSDENEGQIHNLYNIRSKNKLEQSETYCRNWENAERAWRPFYISQNDTDILKTYKCEIITRIAEKMNKWNNREWIEVEN